MIELYNEGSGSSPHKVVDVACLELLMKLVSTLLLVQEPYDHEVNQDNGENILLITLEDKDRHGPATKQDWTKVGDAENDSSYDDDLIEEDWKRSKDENP